MKNGAHNTIALAVILAPVPEADNVVVDPTERRFRSNRYLTIVSFDVKVS